MRSRVWFAIMICHRPRRRSRRQARRLSRQWRPGSHSLLWRWVMRYFSDSASCIDYSRFLIDTGGSRNIVRWSINHVLGSLYWAEAALVDRFAFRISFPDDNVIAPPSDWTFMVELNFDYERRRSKMCYNSRQCGWGETRQGDQAVTSRRTIQRKFVRSSDWLARVLSVHWLAAIGWRTVASPCRPY